MATNWPDDVGMLEKFCNFIRIEVIKFEILCILFQSCFNKFQRRHIKRSFRGQNRAHSASERGVFRQRQTQSIYIIIIMWHTV